MESQLASLRTGRDCRRKAGNWLTIVEVCRDLLSVHSWLPSLDDGYQKLRVLRRGPVVRHNKSSGGGGFGETRRGRRWCSRSLGRYRSINLQVSQKSGNRLGVRGLTPFSSNLSCIFHMLLDQACLSRVSD